MASMRVARVSISTKAKAGSPRSGKKSKGIASLALARLVQEQPRSALAMMARPASPTRRCSSAPRV
jgi:hypothetical protein